MPTPENIEMLSIADNSPLLQRTGATQSLFSANSAQVSPSLTRQSSFQSGTSSSSEITKPYDKAKEEDSRFQSWLQSDRANGTLIAPRSDPPEQVQFVRRKAHVRWFSLPEGDPPKDVLHGWEPLGDIEAPDESFACFTSAMQDDSTEVGIEASQTNYRLVANYHPVAAGQHKLYLKVKAADSTMPKHRFLARISVYFTVTKMIDTFYASFSASEYDCGPDWYYLKGDGQFEIRGHHETAHVHVSIVMDKKRTDDRLCRLWVHSLELIPAELVSSRPDLNEADNCSSEPRMTIFTQPPVKGGFGNGDTGGASVGVGQETDLSTEQGIIRRLAISRNCEYVAALSVFSEHFTVQVWCKDQFEAPAGSNVTNGRNISQQGASAEIRCLNAYDVPLELALSEEGDYVAVYQTPRVGDWLIGSSHPKSQVGVRLYRNPLLEESQGVPILMTNSDAEGNGREGWRRLSLIPKAVPAYLQDSVGYATFVGESHSYWRDLPMLFVFCNGLYLDVFNLQGDGLNFSHAIPLVHFPSRMWRTVACELAVRSIVSNMFIWVAGDGHYCSTWDLGNGCSLGRIDIGGLPHDIETKVPAIKVAFNEDIIAIVGSDNSITTVEATSGIVIGRRYFDCRDIIDDIVFPSAQAKSLLVFLRQREDEDHEQSVILVDPLCLEVQVVAPPLPSLQLSCIFGHFGKIPWHTLGTMCRQDGDRILLHYFDLHQHPTTKLRLQNPSSPLDTCPYELKITTPRSRHGRPEIYTRQVEIWKRNDPADSDSSGSCIFSFIPEPWEYHRPAGGMILSSGDRFVVHVARTIQLWSLPTPSEPRCRLLFFWSAMTDEKPTEVFERTGIDIVLERHRRFNAVQIHEYSGTDEQTHYLCEVVYPDAAEEVMIPDFPLRLLDTLRISEHCIQAADLLALIYVLVSPHSQEQNRRDESDDNADHEQAIMDFVSDRINHSSKTRSGPFGILTTLLEQWCPPDISAKFVASLLKSNRCKWVPRSRGLKNPVKIAIDHKNVDALQSLLDYCTDMAHRYHPLYMAPIEQCFVELHNQYPERLQAALLKTSYISAQRFNFSEPYVTYCISSWTRLRDLTYSLTLRRQSERRMLEPVFSFQIIQNNNSELSGRETAFRQFVVPPVIKKPDRCKVYIAPFPSLVDTTRVSSFFGFGRRYYFGSAALKAILSYKAWQLGAISWWFRVYLVLLFYGIILYLTYSEVDTPAMEKDSPDYASRNATRIIMTVIAIYIGIVLAVIGFVRASVSRVWSRLWPQYGHFSIICVAFGIFSLVIMALKDQILRTNIHTPLISMTIFLSYIHLLIEIRASRTFGGIVNILMLVAREAVGFALVFAFLIIGSTHSLRFYFHAFPVDCNIEGSCTPRNETKYPNRLFPALATTLFFLAGRYEAIESDFERGDVGFLALIMAFYFIMVLLVLTMLTGLLTDAYSRHREKGDDIWRERLSELLAEGEIILHLLQILGKTFPQSVRFIAFIRRRTAFQRRFRTVPTYIFYFAHDEEVEKETMIR